MSKDPYTLQQNVHKARLNLRRIVETNQCRDHASVAKRCEFEAIRLNIARVELENHHAQHAH